jgi:hypothetical protein
MQVVLVLRALLLRGRTVVCLHTLKEENEAKRRGAAGHVSSQMRVGAA